MIYLTLIFSISIVFVIVLTGGYLAPRTAVNG